MTITHLSAEELAERHLPLPGTWNVRDIGGYPAMDNRTTRWGTLVRADALHRLDDEGRATFADMGIKTVIDLRESDELSSAPNQLGDLELVTLHRPLFDRDVSNIAPTAIGERTLADTYLLVVDDRASFLVAAVRELAKDGILPAIIHCTAGKDRTGMVIALTLAALGVSDEVIAADFTATGQLLSGEYRADIIERTAARGVPIEQLDALLSSDPELILAFLGRIRERYGDIEAFLATYGMTDEELTTLRQRLLTDATNEEGSTSHD